MDACLARPSRARAIFNNFFPGPSPSSSRLSSGSPCIALSKVTPGPSGTSFAIRSTSPKGILRLRPTSLMAPLAFMVPKVMIWDTLLRPYFSATYWIISSLPLIQKSMSMSGMLILWGFRNRSKRSPYLMGSISVILRQ